MTYAIERHLPSGRIVLDTGKVLIGLRAGEAGPAPRLHSKAVSQIVSADAEQIQAALLRKQPPRRQRGHYVLAWAGAMHPRRRLPTLTPTTRCGRLLAWARGLF